MVGRIIFILILLCGCSIHGDNYVGQFYDFEVHYERVKGKDTLFRYYRSNDKIYFYSTENLIIKFGK